MRTKDYPSEFRRGDYEGVEQTEPAHRPVVLGIVRQLRADGLRIKLLTLPAAGGYDNKRILILVHVEDLDAYCAKGLELLKPYSDFNF